MTKVFIQNIETVNDAKEKNKNSIEPRCKILVFSIRFLFILNIFNENNNIKTTTDQLLKHQQ